jgi:hypothetical protein
VSGVGWAVQVPEIVARFIRIQRAPPDGPQKLAYPTSS